MQRLLPPLNPLRMFEAAARHVSFTHAATELGVSQTAVSRQVAVLEAWMKAPLFERLHSELRLTEAGARYFEEIRGSFDALDTATRSARAIRSRHGIQLRACATLAKFWLSPRLPRFADAYPDLSINLTTTVLPTTFEGTNLDAAIRFGDGRWAGLTTIKLVGDALAPVCNPNVSVVRQPLHRPHDVTGFPLLQSRHRRADWTDWCRFTQVEIDARRTTTMENSAQVYEAARSGAGIAMGQIRLLEESLQSGELLMPFADVLERPLGYYLVYPDHVRPRGKLLALKEWLLDESLGLR